MLYLLTFPNNLHFKFYLKNNKIRGACGIGKFGKIGKEIKWVGLKNYIKVLGKESVWERMQITANFMFWTLLIQALIGLGLALLLNKKFKGNELLTTLIVLPMMLSPAVVGTFWTYLYNPQVGVFSYIMNFFYNFGPSMVLPETFFS